MPSLSVKYRPQDFTDVVGQNSTVMILKKQIQLNKVKNCLIFSGASGTGKTTTARLFAKELNGVSDTAIEIDAASNNGVDNVRDLISTANEHSINSKYKVIIMDEAHMLTTAAWNALLKTIEEPPKYTIFIFCTTNVEKIPATIANRCQRFEFTKISSTLIKERLDFICRQEGFTNFVTSIDYISKHCNNQMRDAITLLEQVSDFDANLDLNTTISIVGGNDYSIIFNLLNNIIDGDEISLITNFETVLMSATSAKTFITQLLSLELDINKYISLGNMSFCIVPECYEKDIKNLIAFEDVNTAKKVHSYFLKTVLEMYTCDNITDDVVLAYLIKLARFE